MLRSGSEFAEQRIDPSRITLARQRRGLSMTALAAELRLTPRALSSYERDGAPVARAALLAEVLSVPPSFFLRGPVDLIEESRVAFRARRRTAAYQRAAATAAGRIGIEFYEWLLERFTVPAPDLPDLDHEDPHLAAGALRARWGVSTGALPNLVHLSEAHGIRVLTLPPGAQQVDAFSLWHDEVPYVFLSTTKSPERSRFDLAHEIGHLVMHSRSGGSADIEREADAFASTLLMPRHELRTRIGRDAAVPQILQVKQQLKVSAMALNRALHGDCLMSDWTYRQNCIRLTQMGYRSGEPSGIARERSRVFQFMFSALKERALSARHIAHELGLTSADLHDLTFGLAVTTITSNEVDQAPTPTGGFRPRLVGGAHDG